MMQRFKRLTITVLLIAAVFSGTAVYAAATDLPSGVLIGDQNGIMVSRDGSYFIDAEALQAGDVITKQLTILNTEPFGCDISMMAAPLGETGPVDLLNEVHLNLKLDGAVIYDGRVRGVDGIDMTRNPLKLGNYQSGTQRTLDITLTVNPGMKTYWAHSEALFKWNFYAEQQVKTDKPKAGGHQTEGPKTGDFFRYGLYVFIAAASLAAGALLLLIRRKRRDSAK